jgi:hypothetical protein
MCETARGRHAKQRARHHKAHANQRDYTREQLDDVQTVPRTDNNKQIIK